MSLTPDYTRLQLRQGVKANINDGDGASGEPIYTTDSKQFYIHDGTSFKHQGLKRTSTSADPTTTEYPNDKDAGIHKNTSSGNIYLAFNNSGSIVKTQLT